MTSPASTSSSSPSVVRFFALAFLVTYALQLPAVAAKFGILHTPVEPLLPLAMLGIFGPAVAAIVVVHSESSSRGVRELFGGLRCSRAGWLYALGGLAVPALALTALLGALRLAGREGPIVYFPGLARVVVGLVISLAEEIGWRGVAQPRLERRYGVVGAAGVTAMLWMLWHVPMFVGSGIPLSWLPVTALYFIGGSLVFGWLRRRTASLLPVVVAHLGAHIDNSFLAMPGDGVPLVVHAVVFGALGLAVALQTIPLGVGFKMLRSPQRA